MSQVLVVDDDRALLVLLRDWLRSGGHSVVALSDFHAAKDYLALNDPDVVVADVRIGAHNGLQLLTIARHHRADVIGVCLTGFDDPVLRTEAQRVGAHYVLKPVTAESLLQLIQ